MDRTYDELRTEVLALNQTDQRNLADDIEHNLAGSEVDDYASYKQEWLDEAKRRLDEYRRGEGTNLTREESMGRVRQMIAEAKRVQR
jgi:hypothetical protein